MTFDRQAYWRNPDGSDLPEEVKRICRPSFFLPLSCVTKLIVGKLNNYLHKSDSIMELGSGTGRNLAGLVSAGFVDVAGLEINQDAIDMGKSAFPELSGVHITCAAVEDAIFKLDNYDCIYTQSILMHLSREADWIFEEISSRANKLIMTIENEKADEANGICWRRNYKEIFVGLGWHELEGYAGTNCIGHSPWTTVRVFTK